MQKSIEDRVLEVETLYNGYAEEPDKTGTQPVGSKITGGIDIDALTIPFGTKKLIKEGESEGNRSEAIMSVINSLVSNRMSESDIFSIFDNYPIGEKYREKGASKIQWLKNHIEKANKFVTVKPIKNDTEPNEASLQFPYEIMSGAAGNYPLCQGSCHF